MFTLVEACKLGDLELVQHLVFLGVNIHENDELPFECACRYGHIEVVKYLVSLGVNIHAEREQAFVYACQNGQLEVVKYLVSLGVNIHIDNEYAFQVTCIYGHLDIAKYLVSLGVNIHADDELAFRNACRYDKLRIVKYLVSLGIYNESIVNGIQQACQLDNYSIVIYLSQFYEFKGWYMFGYSKERKSFHLILHKFMYEEHWMVEKENMKENELWDGNIGMIVASFCW